MGTANFPFRLARPLTRRGIHDFTTDADTIRSWWGQRPDANVAIACGAPGPQVLDRDDPAAARELMANLDERLGPPKSATPRGDHRFFAGTNQGTIALGYGELRGPPVRKRPRQRA